MTNGAPPLSLVVALVLAIMLLVPLAGIVFFRVYENQLIQATEAELIAQSAAIAAATAQRLEEGGASSLPLGVKVGRRPAGSTRGDIVGRYLYGSWSPQLTELDLNKTAILPRRPAPLPAEGAAHSVFLEAGSQIDPILQETQKLTLAGFRVLDFNGVVIAGRDDVGLSLAHVEEVKKALSGRYASALRKRVVENPQPIYSISRGTSVRVFHRDADHRGRTRSRALFMPRARPATS